MRRTLLLAGGALAVAVACTDERANSLDPVGSPAYGVTQINQSTNLPRGTVTFVPRLTDTTPVLDSIRLSISGLDTLDHGFYTVWLGDSTAGNFKRVTGRLQVVRTDTVFNNFGDPVESATTSDISASTAAFSNGGPRNRYVFTTTRTRAGLGATDAMQVLLVTIENTNSATAPSPSRRPIWAVRGEGTLGTTNTSVRTSTIHFGHFSFLRDSVYNFVGTGRGRVLFRDRLLQVLDSSLSRPPVGFYYGVYGIRRDSATNAVKDTVYLGALRSSYPNRDAMSLFNADSLIIDPAVQTSVPPAILAASIRASTDTVPKLQSTSFKNLAQILLVLESKNKTEGRLGTGIILTSDVPGIVRQPPSK
jgi:hypothetical protein